MGIIADIFESKKDYCDYCGKEISNQDEWYLCGEIMCPYLDANKDQPPQLDPDPEDQDI